MKIETKLNDFERRLIQLENDSYITITTTKVKSFFKRLLKICGWVGFIIISIWFVYVFLNGLNKLYGFGNVLLEVYHTLYGLK